MRDKLKLKYARPDSKVRVSRDFFWGGILFLLGAAIALAMPLYSFNKPVIVSELTDFEGILVAASKGNRYGFDMLVNSDGRLKSYYVDRAYTSATWSTIRDRSNESLRVLTYGDRIVSCEFKGVVLCKPKCQTANECKSIRKRSVKLLSWFSLGLFAFSLLCFVISYFKEEFKFYGHDFR